MEYPIHIDAISMGCPFCILSSYWLKFLYNDVFLSLKIDFIVANIADPDEMLHNAAFHLGPRS